MKFLRTTSTARLLAIVAGAVAAIAAGTAISVAATGAGPVPRAKPLAQSLHAAATAKPVSGITADIKFTNNLISSSDFTGDNVDPILQGATGRLWLSKAHGLRLELQSNNGDSQIVVNNKAFWISDPTSKTVYEGTLPADSTSSSAHQKPAGSGVPTVAQIQSELNRLVGQANVSGTRSSNPTDVGGQPAYSVSISPKHDGGLLGQAQLAWDAVTGTPLRMAVYARGNRTPVLELTATHISFGSVPASDLAVSPPAGYKVVKVSTPSASAARSKAKANAKHPEISGVKAVAAHVPFKLAAPGRLDGLPRQATRLLDWGGKPAALVTYGQNLGGLAIVEQAASGSSSAPGGSSTLGGHHLALPTVSINGATGTELATALGTVLHYTSGGVSYTVLGSVPPAAAEQAGKALTP